MKQKKSRKDSIWTLYSFYRIFTSGKPWTKAFLSENPCFYAACGYYVLSKKISLSISPWFGVNGSLNTMTYHDAVEFTIVVAGDASGAVEVEPALLALPDPQHRLMHVAARVRHDVMDRLLHCSVRKQKVRNIERHVLFVKKIWKKAVLKLYSSISVPK